MKTRMFIFFFVLLLELVLYTNMVIVLATDRIDDCVCSCDVEATPALVIPVATMDAQEWWDRTVK